MTETVFEAIAFGLIVTLTMFYLWRKHGHDQD